MDSIKKYFPNLSPEQYEQFAALGELYKGWNQKINVISRKDIDSLYEKHILHSLAIAKFISFAPGTAILDAGTGGGFPGIPLAIIFPEARFHLVDSIGKKIIVVQEIAKAIDLQNVTIEKSRVENIEYVYDFIVSRAVTNLPAFIDLTGHLIAKDGFNKLKNGIIYLKGGDFDQEINSLHRKWFYRIENVKNYYESTFFDTKKIVYLYH
jgi:16S rRNA (guanine527-N7)-methyltransferase